MSASDPRANRPGTALTHVSDSQSFRLLELPPELQLLLEGQSPPLLYLEPGVGSPHAVLVTPTQRYILTQRNTSNSLIILEPAAATSSGSKPGEGETPSAAMGLNVIGTVHETIELTIEPPPPPKSLMGMKHSGSMGSWDEKYGRREKK